MNNFKEICFLDFMLGNSRTLRSLIVFIHKFANFIQIILWTIKTQYLNFLQKKLLTFFCVCITMRSTDVMHIFVS